MNELQTKLGPPTVRIRLSTRPGKPPAPKNLTFWVLAGLPRFWNGSGQFSMRRSKTGLPVMKSARMSASLARWIIAPFFIVNA